MSGLFQLRSIAARNLSAAQYAQATVGNNAANSATPGYSRRRTLLMEASRPRGGARGHRGYRRHSSTVTNANADGSGTHASTMNGTGRCEHGRRGSRDGGRVNSDRRTRFSMPVPPALSPWAASSAWRCGSGRQPQIRRRRPKAPSCKEARRIAYPVLRRRRRATPRPTRPQPNRAKEPGSATGVTRGSEMLSTEGGPQHSPNTRSKDKFPLGPV